MAHRVIKPRKKRPSVNLDTSTCLHVYVYEGNQGEITQILNNKFSEYILDARDDLGRTPLYLAACYRRNELAKQLLGAGCDAKIPQDNGNTVLHEAVEKNSQDIVIEVLKHGASPEISDKAGLSPLFCALTEGSEKSARYMIQSGCDVNKADSNGHTVLYTLLHSKYIKRFEQILEDLLKTG
ncbi:hypothetical protein LOTGIDRAFT_139320 [Lottia gigantea]|uniref:Uncharacterized protein n=1 Tax=Lottia gigantea TaxID=225164 RepID=V4CHP5_LOTGI|nr:hypothetical protein LOTGIDRAFT_139320 [Lottia gigantea]ESP01660.1 hypothetical protein LOTGIDRAFT_139320 [Lottia gigantea]